MSAVELQEHLHRLEAERVAASLEGLASDGAYMADLDGEISDTKVAYVSAAVIEIAVLRAELSGQQLA
jgi:hypothetical protein